MKGWTLLVAVSLVVVLAGCGDDTIDRIEGSGTVLSQERVVEEFDELAIVGFGDVIVEIGDERRLTVEADDNILEYLLTDVSGDRLELKVRPDVSLGPSSDVIYRLTVVDLQKVQVLGSGDVTVDGIDRGRFEASINGSGSVLLIGRADEVDLGIPGSGRIVATELIARVGSVQINGSGNIIVNASEYLDATINGSGQVRYVGDPDLKQTINGTGTISKIE